MNWSTSTTCSYTHSARGRHLSPEWQTQPCSHARSYARTHQGNERSMSLSKAFTWALLALVNVNISTIFTPPHPPTQSYTVWICLCIYN